MVKKAAFHKAFAELQNRISIFGNLPICSLDKHKLQQTLETIGRLAGADSHDPAP